MKGDLIVFRAKVLPGSEFTRNGLIHFPDGHMGMIRSIIDVKADKNGNVYVVGKYREIKKEN